MADWGTADAGAGASPNTSEAPKPKGGDEIADRTAVITARLKTIYRKTVLPVEKRYRYDYFYESPLLTDVEFDGE
jgi:EH domain-containing protein 1